MSTGIDDRREVTDRLAERAVSATGLPAIDGEDNAMDRILAETMADSQIIPPAFNPKAKKYVLWGLGGTLVQFDKSITDAIIEFLPEAAEKLGFRFPVDDAKKNAFISVIKEMARESYEAGNLPTSAVAPFLEINEKILLGETLSLVFSQFIAVNAASFSMFDRSNIKSFEQKDGLSHNLLTTAPSKWAEQCAVTLGIKNLFDRVAGTDIVPSDDGHMLHKRTEASAILEYFFRELPSSRVADVIVVDHDHKFLEKAARMGFETCLLLRPKDDKDALKTRARGFNHVVDSIAQVFEKVLKGRQSGDYAPKARSLRQSDLRP